MGRSPFYPGSRNGFYNGDGDRVAQSIDDGTTVTTTTYIIDVATPLTMVLAHGLYMTFHRGERRQYSLFDNLPGVD